MQGPTTAILLRQRFADLPITETHPKALLWLLGVANVGHQPRDVTPEDLERLFRCRYSSEHERDAALSAWAAQAMVIGRTGWANLVEFERDALFIAGPVGYWLPVAAT